MVQLPDVVISKPRHVTVDTAAASKPQTWHTPGPESEGIARLAGVPCRGCECASTLAQLNMDYKDNSSLKRGLSPLDVDLEQEMHELSSRWHVLAHLADRPR